MKSTVLTSICAASFLSLVLALPATSAHADVLVSNLTEPFRGDTPIGNPEFWGAQSFLPDANNYQLDSIEAIVGNGANSPAVVAQLRKADINGDIDVTAGGLLTTFTAPDMSGATSARTFLPDSSVTLLASETYWFLLGSSNAGTYDWSYADTNLSTGPGALGNFADSSDGGASWILHDGDFPYYIQVIVSPVPEPGALTLCGLASLALLGVATIRRRKRRLATRFAGA